MNANEAYEPAIALALAEYATALSANDLDGVVEAWAIPAFVIDDGGALPVQSQAQVREFFSAAIAGHRARGQVSTHAHLREMEDLGGGVFWVDSRWPAFDTHGHEIHSERTRYLMQVDASGKARILVAATLASAAESVNAAVAAVAHRNDLTEVHRS